MFQRMRTDVLRLFVLVFAAAMWLACADNASSVVPPISSSGFGGASGLCEGGTSALDDLLKDGAWPMVLARVESVEPVLDVFSRAHEDEVSAKICTDLEEADPALRITLRVEGSSWALDKESTVTLVLNDAAFLGFDAKPLLTEKGALIWSDGGSYFPKDSRVLVVGGLLEGGELFAFGMNIFEVKSNDRIAGYHARSCVDGTLNERDVYDVLSLAKKGWNGKTPLMTGDVPAIATRCWD